MHEFQSCCISCQFAFFVPYSSHLVYNLCLGSYILNVRIKQCLLNQQAEQIILLKQLLALVGPALPYQNLHISTEPHQLQWDCAYFIDVIFFPLATKFDDILSES